MTTSPKAYVADNVTQQLTALADYAKQQAAAVMEGQPPKWYRPAGLTASLQDLDAISEPFSRKDCEQQFDDAVIDAANPGTLGDLALVQLQGDLLAAMERAYRARTTTAARSRLHAASRLRGHGHDYGAIRGGLLGTLVTLDQQNKS